MRAPLSGSGRTLISSSVPSASRFSASTTARASSRSCLRNSTEAAASGACAWRSASSRSARLTPDRVHGGPGQLALQALLERVEHLVDGRRGIGVGAVRWEQVELAERLEHLGVDGDLLEPGRVDLDVA